MRLRYWAKITRMEDDRIVKMIYRSSRNRMEREEAVVGSEVKRTKTWCTYTRKLMKKLNLEEEWKTEEVDDEELPASDLVTYHRYFFNNRDLLELLKCLIALSFICLTRSPVMLC